MTTTEITVRKSAGPPAGAGGFNPFTEYVKESFKAGDPDGWMEFGPIPNDDVDDAVSMLRKAGTATGIGVSVKKVAADAGTTTVHFLAREKKTRGAK